MIPVMGGNETRSLPLGRAWCVLQKVRRRRFDVKRNVRRTVDKLLRNQEAI
jgi:hypothetical protein